MDILKGFYENHKRCMQIQGGSYDFHGFPYWIRMHSESFHRHPQHFSSISLTSWLDLIDFLKELNDFLDDLAEC